MRKILIGTLSVAGLFGVVLALAAPASAQKSTVTFTTDTEAGTYTIKWQTQGGCDPGSGTSGASGEATVTVAATGTTSGNPTGSAQSVGVNTDQKCKYNYSATFAFADGRKCAVTVPQTGGTLVVGICDLLVKATITFAPYQVRARAMIPAVTGQNPLPAVPARVAVAPVEPDIGAVKATTFNVKIIGLDGIAATRGGDGTPDVGGKPQVVKPGTPRAAGCSNNITASSKVDSAGNNKLTVTLVGRPHTDADGICSYTWNTATPGFVNRGYAVPSTILRRDTHREANFPRLTFTPCTQTFSGGNVTTDCSGQDVNQIAYYSVLQRTVFLVQNVTGDSDGGRATYNYSTNCGAAGLPPELPVNTGSGGVVRTRGTTSVELREGRFNASLALSPSATDAGLKVHAMDKTGTACNATVAVSGLPAACTADSATKSANLVTASGSQVILEFMINCTPPPPPTTTTAAPPPTTTTEAMSMDDDMDMDGDMDGDDDMNGDMGGDMGGDTGPQAMGDTG